MRKNKVEFEVDGKKFAVVRPTSDQRRKSDLVKGKAFREAVESGCLLRSKIDSHLRSQAIWDDEKEAEFARLQKSILEAEKAIKRGGIPKKEAYRKALDVRQDRFQLRLMRAAYQSLDQFSCESQAENAAHEYLCSQCVLDAETGKPVFSSLEDYRERSEEPVAFQGASKLMNLLFDLEDQPLTFEEKFLREYGYTDKEGRLVNKAGHLVDSEGRLLDEQNRFVNDRGELVDAEGNRVSESGEFIMEFRPFLEDEGEESSPEGDNPPATPSEDGENEPEPADESDVKCFSEKISN